MPIDPAKYQLIRCVAIIVGFLIISISAITVSFVFYADIFHFTNFGVFIAPILLVLLPAMLFVLGIGIALGELHPALVYALIPVTLLLTLLPLPDALNLLGGSFFSSYPTMLNIVEPPFSVPLSVLVGKTVYTVIGILLTLLGIIRFRKVKHQAN